MNRLSISQENKIKQLELGNMIQPLPLHVADKWDFDLTYYVQDNKHLYAVTDWLSGLGISSNRGRANIIEKLGSEVQIHHLEIETSSGVQLANFTNDEGLYRFAQEMRSTKNRPQLKEIKDYLVKAGVLVDKIRRGTVTPKQVSDSMRQHLNRGAYTEDYQAERIENVKARKQLSGEIIRTVEGNVDWGHVMASFNISLTGKTKKQILADYEHVTSQTSAIDGMGSMVVNQMNFLMKAVKMVLATYAEDGIPNKRHTASIERIVTKHSKPLREQLEMLAEETGQPLHKLGENTKKVRLI